MKKTPGALIGVLNFLLISFNIIGQASDEWHYPLYLSNMDYWHSRIPVEVENSSAMDVSGESIKMNIGNGTGQLHLVGVEAGELRVVDSRGTELLWRVTSPGREILTEGELPDKSEFLLPVTVKAGESDIYYIYYNNPAAWSIGAVLEINNIARFGAIKITSLPKDALKVEIKSTQTISLKEQNRDYEWPKDDKWNIRVPIKILNFVDSQLDGLPVYVKMEQIYLRLHGKVGQYTPMQLGSKSLNPCFRFNNALLFESPVSASSEQTTFAYFAGREKQDGINHPAEYQDWYNDKRNLAKNPGIAQGEANWSRLTSDAPPENIEQGISGNGSTDGQSLRLHLPAGEKPREIGWTQNISIEPGHTYMFGAMARCNDISEGISLRIQFLGQNETLLKGKTGSDKINGTEGWTFISGVFLVPEEAVKARMTLVLAEPGTAWFKGMLMMEVIEGNASSLFFDQRQAQELDKLAVWPVNPIVKVFREDLPPEQAIPMRISAAQNETEPLQLALRSSQDCSNMRVEVILPENSGGKRLDQVGVSVVGYVPIDYPSNYYEKKVPYWHLKYPTEAIGSDGWSGFWPDPLIPRETFELAANTTQPIWIEVTVPEGTLSGDYTGQIKVFQNDSLVKEIPWTVHVWDFALPQKNTFGAIYDIRSVEDMPEPMPDLNGNDLPVNESRDMYLSFMAKHRISSGEISPAPDINYLDGKVNIDFTGYDKAASYYFDELKNPFAYLPVQIFYLFGWAFPPAEKFNEKPYPGEYPYKEADRSKLRPEYKKAYQLVLKTFWEHIREKGWADRYILYLSDEPHEADNNNGKSNDINIQMKALCDMIHEVNPEIPIYVSTWWYRPEWEGYIDVWGLGFNGEGDYGHYVTAEDMQHITRSGDRIWYTTDGNFCTETPYLALERLLPWFGYKYGAEAYEFWGVNWLTFNPYKYGWHSYIFESQAPGEESWKRYPNGDGFVIYPGKPIGQEGLVASIRLKQVREGAEDYEYLALLGRLIETADSKGQPVKTAREALQQALKLVNIPCAMGRYSTKILTNPDEVFIVREQVAKSIEALGKK